MVMLYIFRVPSCLNCSKDSWNVTFFYHLFPSWHRPQNIQYIQLRFEKYPFMIFTLNVVILLGITHFGRQCAASSQTKCLPSPRNLPLFPYININNILIIDMKYNNNMPLKNWEQQHVMKPINASYNKYYWYKMFDRLWKYFRIEASISRFSSVKVNLKMVKVAGRWEEA